METKPNLLKISFEDVYGTGLNPTNYTEIEYSGTRLTPNANNVYVFDCFFHDILYSSLGGAIYCNNSVHKLLIEQSSFISCKTSGNSGGGIYFSGSGSLECVMSKICAFDCSCIIDGQFAHIEIYNYAFCKCHFNDSTITHSLKGDINQKDSINLNSVKILFPSNNLTNNECYGCPAFTCATDKSSTPETCTISYCSVVNNTANGGYCCIRLYRTDTTNRIDTCNIINNKQTSSEYGIILAYTNILIKDSCILGNDEGKTIFYVYFSANKITISKCTYDNNIYSGSGSVIFTISVESSFIYALSHIVTRNCDSFFDSYGTITAIPPPSPTEAETHFPTEAETHFPTEAEIHSPTEAETENRHPTWDGEWAEEAGIIIIDDDIPIIRSTHYPLQTEYVKTTVPSVTTATNISVGAIVIIFIVVISLYNFIRSAKKLTSIGPHGDKYEVNSEEYVDISNSNYST